MNDAEVEVVLEFEAIGSAKEAKTPVGRTTELTLEMDEECELLTERLGNPKLEGLVVEDTVDDKVDVFVVDVEVFVSMQVKHVI